MFTATAHKNQAGAEGYFDEHLSQNDYYATGEIRAGQWIGVGAESLGLKQNVSREQFHALCENRNPQTGERLTQRQHAENSRRVYYDFTCSAPKSVSILAVTLNDERLVAAHEEAARIALRELETYAATRVRKLGNQTDRPTGNLVAAAFAHTSSRALDPQLHTHFTVFNATRDETEMCWKALQVGPMYDAIRYGTAVYRNELARRILEIGYRIVPAKHGFEIEGVSPELLKRFSKRSAERDKVVLEMEQRLGRKLTNNEVSHAVHQSRARKITGISTVEVRKRQLTQLSLEERQSLQKLCSSAQAASQPRIAGLEQQVLNQAVAHVFERKSVVPKHELLNVALSNRPGEVDLPILKQAVEYSEYLVKTERGFSTKEILATERDLIHTVNAACDTVGPLNYGHTPAGGLSEDQQRAIYHVLRTSDRITGLRGLAGSGKTTALRELVAACKAARIEPLFCASTAAATDVLRKEGFEAVTLQNLMQSKRTLSGKELIVVDEAGAVGIDDMRRLFDMAQNCRIVLSGDTGQHASVARGDALRILEHHSRFQSGQLTRIRRQRRADYRKAVELAAKKETALAFAQLERMSAVVESSQLHDSAAKAYLKALEQNKSVLLVAPTWNEIEAVTEKVRTALKTFGWLAGKEKEFAVFDSLSWTEAQKRDTRQYRTGQVLHFHRAVAGFVKGDSAEVVQVSDDSLELRHSNGSVSSLPLNTSPVCFDVGEQRKIGIISGDKLMLQANSASGCNRFVNGELVEVKAIQGDSVLLTDGRVIPANYRTFTHGYAVTSHAAQGKTVDEVLVVASSRSLPAVSQEQFYVSISRGRDICLIYTDDADLLRSHVARSSARLAAVEAIPRIRRRQLIQTTLQRGYRFLKQLHKRFMREQSLAPRGGIHSQLKHHDGHEHSRTTHASNTF